MPIFRYKGYGAGGGTATGTVEADGPRDAAIKLKAQGLHPWEIMPHGAKAGRAPLFDRFRQGTTGLAALTRQMSVLLGAGVTLVEALKALSKEKQGRARAMLIDIREKVAGGARLSRALEAYPGVFPEYYRGMVEAGESSGTLDQVLGRMAEYLEAEESVRNRVRSAMIYPLFMTAVSMVVLSFLFAFVVPKIVKLFENTKASLPVPTKILIAMSSFLTHYWWLALICLVIIIPVSRTLAKRHRIGLHKTLGRIFGELYISRFARSLGFLLEGGLPVMRALELSGKTTGNEWMLLKCREAADSVSGGSSLSSAFEGVMPPVFLELLATGEQSGRLPEVLGHAARGYESEFDRKVQSALSLLEPSLILLMGAVVGFIVFAVLLPMFQLNQLVR